MSKPYLHTFFKEHVAPELQKTRGYSNVHEIPKLEKIVLNSGYSADLDKSQIEEATKEMSLIAGQKPIITKARISVANFKLREGVPNGAKVTLRGRAMYEFLYRLIAVALPGIRDFRGIPDKFDGNGNYTLGISDNTIFPEVHHDGSKHTFGMDIVFVTTANSDEEGRELLSLMGMPFRKRNA
jgi:large subunit ribosomal protein L5